MEAGAAATLQAALAQKTTECERANNALSNLQVRILFRGAEPKMVYCGEF